MVLYYRFRSEAQERQLCLGPTETCLPPEEVVRRIGECRGVGKSETLLLYSDDACTNEWPKADVIWHHTHLVVKRIPVPTNQPLKPPPNYPPPPSTYICHQCLARGNHERRHCPVKHELPEHCLPLRRASGIPMTLLRTISDNDAHLLLRQGIAIMVLPSGQFVVHR